MNNWYTKLYDHRFELFLGIQLCTLFGSLVIPITFFDSIVLPILYSISTGLGVLIVSKNKKIMWFCIGLFSLSLLLFGGDQVSPDSWSNEYLLARISVYFVINIFVTLSIIKQVWHEQKVDRKVILGLISGYIALGFLGFFLFISIDLTHENAFTGLLIDNGENFKFHADSLLYYSFITLLTIGYGEIIPAIPVAQKAAILVGLIGQIYLTIVTAIIVSKYINHSVFKSDN